MELPVGSSPSMYMCMYQRACADCAAHELLLACIVLAVGFLTCNWLSGLTWTICLRHYIVVPKASAFYLSRLTLRLGALLGQQTDLVFSSSVQGQNELLRCPVAWTKGFLKCSERFRTVLADPLAVCRMCGRHVRGRTKQH